MVRGIDDALAWFTRTGKTGWRLSQNKKPIAEYFVTGEASNTDAGEKLKVELESLMGGQYEIDAKDKRDESRVIIYNSVMIPPTGHQPVVMSGTHQQGGNQVPQGYMSRMEVNEMLERERGYWEIARDNDDIRAEMEQMRNAPSQKTDAIGAIVEKVPWDQVIGMMLQKFMGPPQQIAGPSVRIAGAGGRNVPPVSPVETQQDGTQQPELNNDQGDRLDFAFYQFADLENGDLEMALQVMEALPKWIMKNPGMYKYTMRPALLEYKDVQLTQQDFDDAMKILNP